jgi:hypothetical protein
VALPEKVTASGGVPLITLAVALAVGLPAVGVATEICKLVVPVFPAESVTVRVTV